MSDTGPLVSPRLQGLLARSRLRPLAALPTGGQGDRSSRAKGSGLEFAEHRPYQPGDDLRHIDPHLEARLGETYIREYNVDQQLPVTILLDTSMSMGTGEPAKLEFALRLAAAIGYLGLSGNDRVRLASYADERILWTRWFSGVRQTERMFAWLSALEAAGTADPSRLVREVVPQLPATGLVIMISDWLAHDPGRVPTMLGGEGRDVIGIHVHAPAEADPSLLGAGGDLRITDSETGEELEVALNDQALDEYRRAWREFTDGLRDSLLSQQALYLPVSSGADVESVLLRDWTRLGLILR